MDGARTPVAAVSRTAAKESGIAWNAVLGWTAFAVSLLVYAPTYLRLYNGPWQTEQEGHGPLIMLASAYLAWRKWGQVAKLPAEPAYVSGWASLVIGLFLMAIGRSQDLLVVEAASQLLVVCGVVLLALGAKAARALWFPIAFLFFSVPPPGWMLDAMTVPLKGMISDVVASVLYNLGYPVAQNGVMIMVGPYQLLVKDACSGMNSIFALSAIGIFYIYEMVRDSLLRTVVLALAIIPISVLANFLRVVALVLITYYAGPDAAEGLFHDFTGILLFVVAIVLFFALDGLLLFGIKVASRRRPAAVRGA